MKIRKSLLVLCFVLVSGGAFGQTVGSSTSNLQLGEGDIIQIDLTLSQPLTDGRYIGYSYTNSNAPDRVRFYRASENWTATVLDWRTGDRISTDLDSLIDNSTNFTTSGVQVGDIVVFESARGGPYVIDAVHQNYLDGRIDFPAGLSTNFRYNIK